MEYMNDYDPKMIGKRIKETAQSKGYTAETTCRNYGEWNTHHKPDISGH